MLFWVTSMWIEPNIKTDMTEKLHDIIWFGFNIDLTDLSWSNIDF